MDDNSVAPSAAGRSLRLPTAGRPWRVDKSAAADGAGSRNPAGQVAKVVCLGGQMKGRQTSNSWLMELVD
jgi:hypothetical protein